MVAAAAVMMAMVVALRVGIGRAFRVFRDTFNRYVFLKGKEIEIPIETADNRILRRIAADNLACVSTYT